MSGLARRLMATGAAAEKLYVDDVFSTFLYQGNGSTQTINNGIDLAGKGGLVWRKNRSGTAANHYLQDSTRTAAAGQLSTNNTNGASYAGAFTFNSDGFTAADVYGNGVNTVSWTFRKAPKFFDVVTYTGNGSTKYIQHTLGVDAGTIIVRRSDNSSNWVVWHRSSSSKNLRLNTTDSDSSVSGLRVYGLGSSVFGCDYIASDSDDMNANGATYVAYLFAHDASADGIIQCGSFTTDASGNATVNLGWEPQYLMYKSSSGTSNWTILDQMRGWWNPASGANSNILRANLSDAELAGATTAAPNATGFTAGLAASTTYIYLAIRRPNKPPTTGTQVFDVKKSRYPSGQGEMLINSGFPTDSVLRSYNGTNVGFLFWDRLRGNGRNLYVPSTNAESSSSTYHKFDQNGFIDYLDSAWDVFHYQFRRAPGFFDVVCWKASGNTVVNHSLSVSPELAITKDRSQSASWRVYSSLLPNNNFLLLNGTQAILDGGAQVFSANTATFQLFGQTSDNDNYIAYLFASLPGISKCGSYTGNGTSQTINCGFTTGARFILIKRTDAVGDWYLWDSARGIVAANDPHLSLNTTAAEVTTDDSVDPDASGFIVNQNTATNINVSGASYIFLAIS